MESDASYISDRLEYLAKKFGIKCGKLLYNDDVSPIFTNDDGSYVAFASTHNYHKKNGGKLLRLHYDYKP